MTTMQIIVYQFEYMPRFFYNKNKMNDDFIKAIFQLDGLTASHSQGGNRFIILFKLTQPEGVIIRIMNHNNFWMHLLDRKYVAKIREKIQIEGTIQSFCELILHSIRNKKFEFALLSDGALSMLLHFQLGKLVFLKAEINLGQPLPVMNDEDFKILNSQFIYDLYDAMSKNRTEPIQLLQNLENEGKSNISFCFVEKQDQQEQTPNQFQYVSQQDSNIKKKPKADMIMPNMKKRRVQGAKIG